MRPVLAGLWRQYETWDGTYTGDDLLDIHEMLDVRNANAELARANSNKS